MMGLRAGGVGGLFQHFCFVLRHVAFAPECRVFVPVSSVIMFGFGLVFVRCNVKKKNIAQLPSG